MIIETFFKLFREKYAQRVGNCSNSRVPGNRELIREAGRDFREVIPGLKNFTR